MSHSTNKYLNSLHDTLNYLFKIYKESNKELEYEPIGVYYESDIESKDSITDNKLSDSESKNSITDNKLSDVTNKDKLLVTSIIIKNDNIVPVLSSLVNKKDLDDLKLIYKKKTFIEEIDKAIKKKNIVIDKRITDVTISKFTEESYELFRFEFSNLINSPENSNIKKFISKIIEDSSKHILKDNSEDVDIVKKNKILIRLLLYKIIDDSLYEQYSKKVNANVSVKAPKNFVKIIKELPNLKGYQINNNRVLCADLQKESYHCTKSHGTYYLGLTLEMVIRFVNMISNELVGNSVKSYEIMQVGDYNVSDIVDRNIFNKKEGQVIIKSSNSLVTKTLNELFKNDNIPIIGKRKIKKSNINIKNINDENPLIDMDIFYVQNIFNNDISIYRTYVNCYYWIKNSLYDLQNRNLGYYNDIQTDLAYYFRSTIIDWIQNKKNQESIKPIIEKYIGKDINMLLGNMANTNSVVELYLLNKIQKIPIIVMNDDNDIIYYFDKDIFYDKKYDNKTINIPKSKMKASIVMKFNLAESDIPDKMNAIYYK